jgi:hypothetical protein
MKVMCAKWYCWKDPIGNIEYNANGVESIYVSVCKKHGEQILQLIELKAYVVLPRENEFNRPIRAEEPPPTGRSWGSKTYA